MTIDQIIDYHRGIFADLVHPVAWMFLWRVAAMQDEALLLVAELGFVVKSEIVWVKSKQPGGGRVQMGMGHYARNAHETCLICVRGSGAAKLRKSASEPSVLYAPRGIHSAKPEAFYHLIKRLCTGPYLELFARTVHDGFLQMGDELPLGSQAAQ